MIEEQNTIKIGIVCGYGSVLDENLKKYINCVIEYAIKNQITTLILSGGHTSKKSAISEAKLMLDFCQKPNSCLIFVLEEKSITTLHNLLYAKQIIDGFKSEKKEVYIFCDNVRFMKVNLMSRIIFRGESTRVIKIARKEHPIMYIVQLPSTFIQCLGVIFPIVEKKIFIHRQNWIDKSG